MGARSYIPQLGRFLQTDPVPGGSANAYAYTYGDPINQTDLTGELTWGWTEAGMKESEATSQQTIAENAAREEAERKAAEAAAQAQEESEGPEEAWEEEGEEGGMEGAAFGPSPMTSGHHMSEEEEEGVYFQPLAEGQQPMTGPTQRPLPLCERGHQGRPCGQYICAFDRDAEPPVWSTTDSKTMYWEVCNRKGHRVGFIRWIHRSEIKRWTSHKKGKSLCKAVSVGVSGVSVAVGGAGIVAAGTGQEEIAAPLLIASGMGDLVGVGIDFARDFTGC